jgi:fructose-1,6-bisphosphatase/inositol monophosphatase family enzyme
MDGRIGWRNFGCCCYNSALAACGNFSGFNIIYCGFIVCQCQGLSEQGESL